jgi:hypothetical protein
MLGPVCISVREGTGGGGGGSWRQAGKSETLAIDAGRSQEERVRPGVGPGLALLVTPAFLLSAFFLLVLDHYRLNEIPLVVISMFTLYKLSGLMFVEQAYDKNILGENRSIVYSMTRSVPNQHPSHLP